MDFVILYRLAAFFPLALPAWSNNWSKEHNKKSTTQGWEESHTESSCISLQSHFNKHTLTPYFTRYVTMFLRKTRRTGATGLRATGHVCHRHTTSQKPCKGVKFPFGSQYIARVLVTSLGLPRLASHATQASKVVPKWQQIALQEPVCHAVGCSDPGRRRCHVKTHDHQSFRGPEQNVGPRFTKPPKRRIFRHPNRRLETRADLESVSKCPPPPPSCRLFFYPFKTGPSLDTSQSRTVRADAAGIQGRKIFLSRPNVLGHFQGIGRSVPRLTWTGSPKELNRDGPPLKGWFAHLRLKTPSHVHHSAPWYPICTISVTECCASVLTYFQISAASVLFMVPI